MQATEADWAWLAAPHVIDQRELERMCGLQALQVDELVEYGALVPLPEEGGPRVFDAGCVPPLREALRLHAVFDLDLFAVGLLTGYLQRIQHLEQQVHALRAQVPHPVRPQRDGPAPWHEPHGCRDG
jgi:hypothetical protein